MMIPLLLVLLWGCEKDKEKEVEKLLLDKVEVQLVEGETGKVLIASGNGSYSVSSADEAIAKGSVSGKTITITAVAPGATKLSVKDKERETAEINVTVKAKTTPVDPEPGKPGVIAFEPATAEVEVGNTVEVAIKEAQGEYTATSSDEAKATASVANGTFSVTGVAEAESVAITVLSKDGKAKGTFTVKVIAQPPVTPVALVFDPTSVEVEVDETVDVAIKNAQGEYIATSSDETKATVSAANGKVSVTGVAEAESVTITVKGTDPLSEGTFTVKVKAKAVTPPGPLTLETESVTIISEKDQKVKIISGNGEYELSGIDETIATAKVVNSKVVISPVNNGETTVTVTDKKNPDVATNRKTISVTVAIPMALAEGQLVPSPVASETYKVIAIEEGGADVTLRFVGGKTPYGAFDCAYLGTNFNLTPVVGDARRYTLQPLKGDDMGSFPISIQDADGKKVEFYIYVKPKPKPFTVDCDDAITLTEGDKLEVNVTSMNGNVIKDPVQMENNNGNIQVETAFGGGMGLFPITITALKATTTPVKVILEDEKKVQKVITVTVKAAPLLTEIKEVKFDFASTDFAHWILLDLEKCLVLQTYEDNISASEQDFKDALPKSGWQLAMHRFIPHTNAGEAVELNVANLEDITEIPATGWKPDVTLDVKVEMIPGPVKRPGNTVLQTFDKSWEKDDMSTAKKHAPTGKVYCLRAEGHVYGLKYDFKKESGRYKFTLYVRKLK